MKVMAQSEIVLYQARIPKGTVGEIVEATGRLKELLAKNPEGARCVKFPDRPPFICDVDEIKELV